MSNENGFTVVEFEPTNGSRYYSLNEIEEAQKDFKRHFIDLKGTLNEAYLKILATQTHQFSRKATYSDTGGMGVRFLDAFIYNNSIAIIGDGLSVILPELEKYISFSLYCLYRLDYPSYQLSLSANMIDFKITSASLTASFSPIPKNVR